MNRPAPHLANGVCGRTRHWQTVRMKESIGKCLQARRGEQLRIYTAEMSGYLWME
jgi:hypothetical protein